MSAITGYPCAHLKAKTIASETAHRWCRGCGALYVFHERLGWHWLVPHDAHRTQHAPINPDPRVET